MTKEELKQEAQEWLCNNLHSASEEDFIKAMIDIAEPREKKIKSLGERCLQLQKDKGELVDKVKDLEKENAELKHIIATLRQEKDNVSMHAKAMEVVAKTRSDQLTKAKELLKQWLQTSKASSCDNINIVTDTEQFLNSEVEKRWKR